MSTEQECFLVLPLCPTPPVFEYRNLRALVVPIRRLGIGFLSGWYPHRIQIFIFLFPFFKILVGLEEPHYDAPSGDVVMLFIDPLENCFWRRLTHEKPTDRTFRVWFWAAPLEFSWFSVFFQFSTLSYFLKSLSLALKTMLCCFQ